MLEKVEGFTELFITTDKEIFMGKDAEEDALEHERKSLEGQAIETFVNKAMEYLLAKYQYDALDDPELVDKIKYSHNIELKGETLNFIRVGKKDPGILEIMKANNNLNINP